MKKQVGTGDSGSKAGTSTPNARQSREKASRFAVLGMLSMGSKSGYDIKKTIAVSTANFWSESYGNIYPVLKQLLAEGAIKAEQASSADARRKQLYRITALGRQMLLEWLRQPVELQTEDNELLLKLFFGAAASRKEMLSVLRDRRAQRLDQLERYAEIAAFIAAQDASDEEKIYWMATLRYGELSSRAEIAWCEETERRLAGSEKKK
jgi:PadR family transcriptional regulator AphA